MKYFGKILIIILENFDNHFKKFREMGTSVNVRKLQKICLGVLRYIIKTFENYLKNFQKKFGTFRELLRRISISDVNF